MGEAPIAQALHGRTFGLRGAHYWKLHRGMAIGLVADAVRNDARFRMEQQGLNAEILFPYYHVRVGFDFSKGFPLGERARLGFHTGFGLQQSFWQVPDPVSGDDGTLFFGGAPYRKGGHGNFTEYITMGLFSDFALSNGHGLRLGLQYQAVRLPVTFGTYNLAGMPDTLISGYLHGPRGQFLFSLAWQFAGYGRKYGPPTKPDYDPESVLGMRQRIQEIRAENRQERAAEVFDKGWWLSGGIGHGMNGRIQHNIYGGPFLWFRTHCTVHWPT